MTRITVVALVFAASGSVGCPSRDLPQLIVPAPDRSEPSVRRVELAHEYQREVFKYGHRALGGTTAPIESFIYDPSGDRFLVPGFVAVDRSGGVTFEPEPLIAPANARPRTAAELRATWVPPVRIWESRPPDEETAHVRALRYGHIMAVWYGSETIVVLCAQNVPTKSGPHSRHIGDSFLLRRLDARTLSLVDEMRLLVAGGWDPRATLRQFLRDGTVIVRFGGNRETYEHAKVTPGRIPHTPRGYSIVRFDPDGTVTEIHRGSRQAATITPWGEIVVVELTRNRSQLVGVDFDGHERFRHTRAERVSSTRVATHRDGFCTLDETTDRAPWSIISCYDRNAGLRWRRSAPFLANDWLVGEAGWIYLVVQHYDDAEIVAITPEGAIGWRLRDRPPEGGMMVVDDELCFITGPSTSRWRLGPELVCVRPGGA